jgi:hypothetical protein
MKLRRHHSSSISGAKAGFSTATAYRFEQDPPPSEPEEGSTRTAPRRSIDCGVGERSSSHVEGGSRCRRHPELGSGTRWTQERRIRAWRAVNGPDREVIFRLEHPPGRMGLSDFTEVADLGITISAVLRTGRGFSAIRSWSMRRAPVFVNQELRRPGRQSYS